MSQDGSKVKVLLDDGETLVIEDRNGKAKTFHLNTNRAMSLHIHQLQVSQHPGNQASLPGLGNDKREIVPIAPICVRGQARIEGGSISVIGVPANTSTTLDVGFSPLDEDIYKKQQTWAREWGTTARYTQATLGFVRHQPSISASEDWFVECELAADALRALAGAVHSGRLQAMTIGLIFDRIYSDDWTHPQEPTNWFLRPNRRDNNGDDPEMAYGDLTRLCFDLAPLNCRPLLGARAEPQEFANTIPMLVRE